MDTRSAFRTLAAAAALALVTLAGTAGGAAAGSGSAQADPSPVTGGPINLKQASALVQPSIVYLQITVKGFVYETAPGIRDYLKNGNPFTVNASCTGFVVNPNGWIATAGHCVDPQEAKLDLKKAAAQWAINTGYYKQHFTVDQLTGPDDTYRIDNYDENGKLVHNKIDQTFSVAWGGSVSGVSVVKNKRASVEGLRRYTVGDAGLLKVDEADLNALPIAAAGTELSINDEVLTIGYPGVIETFTDPDLTPTFNNGTITSLKTVGDGLLKVYQTNASLSPGMSGGPTVDATGSVVGINSTYYQGESFNYAFPSDQIRQLLASAGVSNELTATTQRYRSGIRAYFSGDKATAVRDLQSVVDQQPANAVAEDYLKRAKDLPDPKPVTPAEAPIDQGGGVPMWLWMALVALVLLAAVGGALALVSRRRGRGGPTGPLPATSPAIPPDSRVSAVRRSGGADSTTTRQPGPAGPADATTDDTAAFAVSAPPHSTEPTTIDGGDGAVGRHMSGPAGTPGSPSGPGRPAGPVAGAAGPVAGAAGPAGPDGSERAAVGVARGPATTGVPQQSAHRFCTQCGTLAEPGFKFCGACGSPL